MTPEQGVAAARRRMILAWAAFAAWVAWLAWQAVAAGRFPVVSRAQFLAADFAVVAEVRADAHGRADPAVRVVETIWPEAKPDRAGQELIVANLPNSDEFVGPGRYVLPLSNDGAGGVRLAVPPISPLAPVNPRPTIYPDQANVRSQLKEIRPALR